MERRCRRPAFARTHRTTMNGLCWLHSCAAAVVGSFSSRTTGIGTTAYASPEQLRQDNYDEKTDIYSLGIILFELYHPFSTKMERAKVLNDLRTYCRLPSYFVSKYPHVSTFVQQLIQHNPSLRPSAHDILHSEFVANQLEQHAELWPVSTDIRLSGGGGSGGGGAASGVGGGANGGGIGIGIGRELSVSLDSQARSTSNGIWQLRQQQQVAELQRQIDEKERVISAQKERIAELEARNSSAAQSATPTIGFHAPATGSSTHWAASVSAAVPYSSLSSSLASISRAQQ